jgi:hypothetical protein
MILQFKNLHLCNIPLGINVVRIVIQLRIGRPVNERKHDECNISRIGRLLIELREIYREDRGKTEEPSIKTGIIEEKQRNYATK